MALGNLSDQYKDVWLGGKYLVQWWQAGDGSMRAGMVCSDDDADEVKLCVVDGIPFGVIAYCPYIDLDTAHVIGTAIPMHPIGSGGMLAVAHDTQVENSEKGGLVRISTSTTAGCIENGSTAGKVVGVAQELIASADKFVKVLV